MNKFCLPITVITMLAVAVFSGGALAADFSSAADRAAMQELKQKSFVKDLYVSPDHMNIGVLRREKDWASSMFARWACGALDRAGSRLRYARFVDIEEVAFKKKSPAAAEISKFQCR